MSTRPSAHATLAVAAGAVVGALLRWVATEMLPTSLPWGVLVVNVLGSLGLGMLLARWESLDSFPAEWVPFWTTGFFGGLTTFSAFAADTVLLVGDGLVLIAVGYVLVTLLIGLLAFRVGFRLGSGGRPA